MDQKLLKDIDIRGSETTTELVRDADTGRLGIRLYNEGGYNCVDVDLADFVSWYSTADESLKSEINASIEHDKQKKPATISGAG